MMSVYHHWSLMDNRMGEAVQCGLACIMLILKLRSERLTEWSGVQAHH